MVTGLCFVLLGVLILFYPQILVAIIAGLLILFGLGTMAASWQFRRWHRQSSSRFINWIIRW
jgi:uncharacterized membrane protein YqjE